jgi:hypothetical protein
VPATVAVCAAGNRVDVSATMKMIVNTRAERRNISDLLKTR